MKRSGFKRPQRKPEKVIDYSPRPRATVIATGPARASKPIPKTPDRISHAIRESARGEECTVRIPGVCARNPEATIWSHAPLGAAGKGRSIKALDLCGCYACTYCDAVVDGQAPMPPGYTRDLVLMDWMFGHLRSLVMLRQKGLV